MSEELKRKLKLARLLLELTQKAMAEKMGIPMRTLIKWENDQATPRGFALTQLNAMLDALIAVAEKPRRKAAKPKSR